jgi:soluble lytic murein transglycosylase-like protein
MKLEILKSERLYACFCAFTISLALGFYAIIPRAEARYLAEQPGSGEDSLDDSDAAALAAAPTAEPTLEIPSLDDYSLANYPQVDNQILTDYRNSRGKQHVIDFFSKITSSDSLASQILAEANAYNVEPSLAFALAWEESRFDTEAVNEKNNNGSVDRGIFQLNNKSFPHLTKEEFFNPAINARYAMAHLAWCLERGRTVVSALAMYNAGTSKVSADNTPKRTLDYVSRILQTKTIIEQCYLAGRMIPAAALNSEVAEAGQPAAQQPASTAEVAVAEPAASRFSLFSLNSAER